MKKTSITLCIVALVTLMSLAPSQELIIHKSIAKANQVQGYYLFVDCEPVAEYEYLGTVKYTIGLGGSQYSAVKNALVKKAKKKFPGGNGIIFHFANEGTDKADIIKFK